MKLFLNLILNLKNTWFKKKLNKRIKLKIDFVRLKSTFYLRFAAKAITSAVRQL